MISAILLAAGESSRFGGNKLLAPLRGRPLILHTLEALMACPFDEVVVVVGFDEAGLRAALSGCPCRIASNPRYREGMSSSIRTGLHAVTYPSGGLLICLGDMPLIRPPEILALLSAFEANPDSIIAPSSAGRQANPVILPRRYWAEIEELRGDVGCKEILKRHAVDVLLVTLPSVGVLQDADTVEALERLRRRLERPFNELRVLIRGAGEMATGVAHRLTRTHFKVCLTELPQPLAIRRRVCFSEAVYEGTATVEGITARLISTPGQIEGCCQRGEVPLLVDPEAKVLDSLQPDVVVDGVMAKRNTGTELADAPLVIGLGPGFLAGQDVHVVIETNRGHMLGSIIENGSAEPDTGKPGAIMGFQLERVIKAPHAGVFVAEEEIGARVEPGQTIGAVGDSLLQAKIKGVLRGIMRNGVLVEAGTKLADIDPRDEASYCSEISDKARTISGGVLEAILMYYNL